MEEMPSPHRASPKLTLAAAKARRDFLEASIAEFTSCACKITFNDAAIPKHLIWM
jgi:hypothetical protein